MVAIGSIPPGAPAGSAGVGAPTKCVPPRLPRPEPASAFVDPAVLGEQRLEAAHAFEILRAEPVVEAAQVPLGLLGRPPGLGLCARALGQVREPGGERG